MALSQKQGKKNKSVPVTFLAGIKRMICMTKNKIRKDLKKRRNEVALNLRKEYSNKIHEKLFAMREFQKCNIIFTYISFGSEVDTKPIINKAFQVNKKVYVPKVEGKDMDFYEIFSLDGLVRSDFGILEPDSNKDQKYDYSLSDKFKKLMILPGLAFDEMGNRIGYGAGYYDRYLSRHLDKEFITMALAYDFQIIDEFPTNRYDIPVDYIITSNKIISNML